MDSIIIESINCRGLRNKQKRNDIFNKAVKERVNILCLQETHLIDEDINTLKNEWNVHYIIGGSEKNAGGTLIALDSNFEHKIHEEVTLEKGRIIIVDIEITDVVRFLLINIYAPNDDSPMFFENLFQYLDKMEVKNLILTGDWNLVNNFKEDTLNYKKLNNPKAQKLVTEYKAKLNLIDVWRHSNNGVKHFTWKQFFYKKMARLDFFLISETLLALYADSHIKISYRSDHSPINLKLNISNHKRGAGNWKLNNSLLMDTELKMKIENEIELIMCTYACTPYSPNYVKNNYKEIDMEFMIDIELLWEVLQAQLRFIIISYASKKKRLQDNRENELKKQIEHLEGELIHQIKNDSWVQNLKEKQIELEKIRDHKLQGILIRSRWQLDNLGEKPSKLFLNLENKNFVSKNIRELKSGNKTINNPKHILEEMSNFYGHLYRKKNRRNW